MSRRQGSFLSVARLLLVPALLCLPQGAQARALDREGTVAILPALRIGSIPAGSEGASLGPDLTLGFAYRPEARFEVGIDLGAGFTERERAGERWEIVSVPVLARFGRTPTPHLDWRPVFQGAVGKAFVSVDGPAYREHAPWVLQATAGLQAELSERIGLQADVGWRYAEAEDPALGSIDLGGFIARAGLFIRLEPEPRRF